jgi:hypothetical protein
MSYINYYNIKKLIFTSTYIFLSSICMNLYAQEYFADKCEGKWKGTMYIYGKGQIRDSVPVELTVQKTSLPLTWVWKTNYLSNKNPIEKNYKLVLKDTASQTYLIDEGEGVELWSYYFINKLYSVFETHDVMLTSSYELQGDDLIFEVTSGKKIEDRKEVNNYSVLGLQRVVFKRGN